MQQTRPEAQSALAVQASDADWLEHVVWQLAPPSASTQQLLVPQRVAPHVGPLAAASAAASVSPP